MVLFIVVFRSFFFFFFLFLIMVYCLINFLSFLNVWYLCLYRKTEHYRIIDQYLSPLYEFINTHKIKIDLITKIFGPLSIEILLLLGYCNNCELQEENENKINENQNENENEMNIKVTNLNNNNNNSNNNNNNITTLTNNNNITLFS
eukprot:292507_1